MTTTTTTFGHTPESFVCAYGNIHGIVCVCICGIAGSSDFNSWYVLMTCGVTVESAYPITRICDYIRNMWWENAIINYWIMISTFNDFCNQWWWHLALPRDSSCAWNVVNIITNYNKQIYTIYKYGHLQSMMMTLGIASGFILCVGYPYCMLYHLIL